MMMDEAGARVCAPARRQPSQYTNPVTMKQPTTTMPACSSQEGMVLPSTLKFKKLGMSFPAFVFSALSQRGWTNIELLHLAFSV
jgi:hypothetical protein